MCVSVYSVLDKEYMDTLSWISPVVEEHKSTLVAGIPQLNMCDVAVMVRFTQNHFFSFNIFSMFFVNILPQFINRAGLVCLFLASSL